MQNRREFLRTGIAALGGLFLKPNHEHRPESDETGLETPEKAQEIQKMFEKQNETHKEHIEHRTEAFLSAPLLAHEFQRNEWLEEVKKGIAYISSTIAEAWSDTAEMKISSRSGLNNINNNKLHLLSIKIIST